MVRFSISQLTTMRWSFHQDVLRYLNQGFQSIGVWRQKVDEYDVLEIADFLHEMKMSVSSVHWAGGFTGGNGFSHKEAIQDAVEAIELTSRLRGNCLIVHPGCRNGHTSSNARRLLRSALTTLVPIAEDYGVRLAIELMPCPNAHNWTFMQQFNCALEFITEFSDDELGIVLDLYHVGLHQEVFEGLEHLSSRLALVQLADRMTASESLESRLALGEGNVPFEKWFHRLSQVGFNGPYEIELHGAGVGHLDYESRLNSAGEFLKTATEAGNLAIPNEPAAVRRPTNRKR
jgi:sugar phosphate isomerase/epimerase